MDLDNGVFRAAMTLIPVYAFGGTAGTFYTCVIMMKY